MQSSQNQQLIKSDEPQLQKSKLLLQGIPEHIINNTMLAQAIQLLPSHYNFEIHKTIYRIESLSKELNKSHLRISLQFPEGLMLFACIICDILKQFSESELNIIIMGDVTYGACCVDDLASDQMDCDLLVHYGHSCLVPVTETKRKVLYIFVEIQIDIKHFTDTVVYNLSNERNQILHILGTIQFNNSLFLAKSILTQKGYTNIVIPQQKPRSAGQVLGCTSPKLPLLPDQKNIVIFLCDGRFHMEATMIANPQYKFYQYNPYTRDLTEEKYATSLMINRRNEQLARAAGGPTKRVCFIFGALGRQGNNGILDRLIAKINGIFQHMVMIASQINVELLSSVPVDFFVQIACPRLSIDWAYKTPKPLLTPYELYALLDKYDFKQGYSMDYYSFEGGPWANFYGKKPVPKSKAKKQIPKNKLQIEKRQQSQKQKNVND